MEEEFVSNLSFVVRRSKVHSNGTTVKFFECNRSGTHSRKQKLKFGGKQLKSQGSCRSGLYCPARIRCEVSIEKEVTVDHISTHVGHLLEPKHVRLDYKYKEAIRLDLERGVEPDVIWRNIEKGYALRAKEWCCAFRVGLRINTNMAVESLHRIVKHDYMKGKVNKRSDKAIHYVLQYLEDKEHDQLVKSVKGKTTKKVTTIWNNHKYAVANLHKFMIETSNEQQYTVQSKTVGVEKYTVNITKQSCVNENCGLIFKSCQVCLDEMCIHCHLVAIYLESKERDQGPSFPQTSTPPSLSSAIAPDRFLIVFLFV